MKKDSLFSRGSIGYIHDPNTPEYFKKPLAFDNDLLLFSAFSESANHVPFERISVIGGRSGSGLAVPGKRFSDIIELPSSEKELFTHSLYASHEKAAIIPLKNKILVIYNQLLRSNGLGIALIFDYSPRCVSALLNSEAINFENVLISPSFRDMPEKQLGAIDFLSSLSNIFNNLRHSDTLSRFEPKCDVQTVLGVIHSASDLMGCPISVDIGEFSSKDIFLDRPTLMSFALCMLSQVRRLSGDRRASIKISAKELFSISIDFDLYSKSNLEKSIFESDFCDRMATEMGIPFSIELNDNGCHSSFIPYRADPSVLGFKAGIFIDGRRITRLH